MKYLTILLFLICNLSKAGTIDPNVPDYRYLEYGKKFNCVVKIKGVQKESFFVSSAVIISPNWALTAAHVVKNSKSIEIITEKKSFNIKKIILKDFDEKKLGYNDIALCYSKDSFDLEFYPELYDKEFEVGKVVSICGFGKTGDFLKGAYKIDYKKRAGSNIIDNIYNNCLICSNLGGVKTELEFMISSGDSGGGLFIDGKLAGINSYIYKNKNSSYGCSSAHTRIKIYKPWIEDNINN